VEARTETVTVTERVKVLAWDDALLERPVFVDIVTSLPAATLAELAARIHLGDVVEAVRKAHEKLPRRRGLAEAERELEEAGQGAASEGLLFELPRELLNRRFVLPEAFETAVKKDLFVRGGYGLLRPFLTGLAEGGPLTRMGMLGRAVQEERTGLVDSPFYLATLLVVLSFLGDQISRRQATPVKIKEAFDSLRSEMKNWTSKFKGTALREEAAERIFANPLAPYGLRRTVPPPSVTEIADQYCSYPNDYQLTPELIGAFDAFYEGDIRILVDDELAHVSLRQRVHAYLDAANQTTRMREEERTAVRRFGWRALLITGLMTASMILPWWLLSPNRADILIQLASPEFLPHVELGLLCSAAAVAVMGLAGLVQLAVRRWRHAGYRSFKKQRRELRRSGPVRAALAALPDFAAYTGNFRLDLPRLLGGYLRLKTDTLEFRRLAQLELPPLDSATLYTEAQLRDKWSQNACVAFEDVYPSLVLGTSNTAAVYFIDVVGSTELSTQQTLSNALELYGRMLKQVNESGFEPLWRKEVGDGRIYSRSPFDALKRAVQSVQGSLHPKIGFQIGVGLSVGEIYRDVTTGDFLNEVTNRASRLNGRDEWVGAWVKARYVRQPFRVHTKYGRLYNTGIAVDENALHAFGASGWSAQAVLPPCEWKYPVLTETATGPQAGSVAYLVERLDPEAFNAKLSEVSAIPAFSRLHGAERIPLGFEVFIHMTHPGLRYPTPLDGRTVDDYLHLHAAERPAFTGRDQERAVSVSLVDVALPTGETLRLSVKPERALLKGLGMTAIAEVEIPAVALEDPDVKLGEFLLKL